MTSASQNREFAGALFLAQTQLLIRGHNLGSCTSAALLPIRRCWPCVLPRTRRRSWALPPSLLRSLFMVMCLCRHPLPCLESRGIPGALDEPSALPFPPELALPSLSFRHSCLPSPLAPVNCEQTFLNHSRTFEPEQKKTTPSFSHRWHVLTARKIFEPTHGRLSQNKKKTTTTRCCHRWHVLTASKNFEPTHGCLKHNKKNISKKLSPLARVDCEQKFGSHSRTFEAQQKKHK